MTRRSYGARLSKMIVSKDPHFRNRVLMENNVPRNLLDNLPDESSPLAQMTLCSAHSRLDNSGLGFLNVQDHTLAR